MDAQAQATPARDGQAPLAWDQAAQALLARLVAKQPVLVQISTAKRLRDDAEQRARAQGNEAVQANHVDQASHTLGLGEPA